MDDFVVRRNDGAPAYQLAVVVDDADAGHRGGGAGRGPRGLDAAPDPARIGCSACPSPGYAHVPLVLGPDGSASPSATAPSRSPTARPTASAREKSSPGWLARSDSRRQARARLSPTCSRASIPLGCRCDPTVWSPAGELRASANAVD